MNESVKMSIGASVALYNTIQSILIKTDTDGKQEERDIPFKTKYKLLRDQTVFEKDFNFYEKERVRLVKKYGVSKEGTNEITVSKENWEPFNKEIGEVVMMEVSHDIMKLSPEEIDYIDDDTINLPATSVKLFLSIMVEDKSLIDDLNKDIEPLEKESSVSDLASGPAPEEHNIKQTPSGDAI